MPATLRPLGIFILLATTSFGVPGCIFPFTRGSDAKLEEVVRGDAQTTAEAPEPRPEPTGKKKLPPFAQFLGEMFSGEQQIEPSADAQVPQTAAVAASPIVSAEAILASEPSHTPPPSATGPKANSQEPLPVVVSPVEVSSNATAETEAVPAGAPSRVVQNTTSPETRSAPPQQTALSAPSAGRPEPEPTIASEQLDEYTKFPWGTSRSLLQQAKQNSAENSTTLAHSLDLALENFRRDNSGQPADSAQGGAANEVTANSKVAEAQPEDAAGDSAENPLRVARGKTDWSGRSMRPSAAPQTILNSTAESYPKTASKPLKWATEAVEEPSQSSAEAPETPASAPQITVNPYADAPKSEAGPAATASPQIVQNPMVSPAVGAENTNDSTDAIHFQASLLGKLQAANQQAVWDFTKAEKTATNEDGDLNIVTSTTNTSPQTGDSTAESSEIPEDGLASMAESADEAAAPPIQPFIIADPRLPSIVPRGTIVRPASPAPQVVNNPQVPATSTGASKLPPVVRASEYQGPASASSSRGTKIYVIESSSP